MKIKTDNISNKGNMYNIALINNSAQVNNDLTLENKIEIKTGIFPFFKSFLGKLTYKFIGNFEYEIKKFEYELKQKIEAIPDENITEPRLSIAGPTLDYLKYNLCEKQIKDMYINILMSEIDITKQNKVLPSYIEIVKQISKDDAIFIKCLRDTKKKSLSICFINLKEKDSDGYIQLDTIIVDKTKNNASHIIIPQKIVLENLERLNIIKINRDTYIPSEIKDTENAFNYYKSHTHSIINDSSAELCYDQGILEITNFGQNFIEICCS